MGRRPFPMTPVPTKPFPPMTVVIKHTMSWREMNDITDATLVPILRSKGMFVTLKITDHLGGRQKVSIIADYGTFMWSDSGMYRTFVWEGVPTISDEKAKQKLAELREPQPKKSHVDPINPPRSIDLNHED